MSLSTVPVYRSYIGLQRGRGLGSLFSGLIKVLVPTLKTAGRTALKISKHPLTRQIGKHVGKVAVGTLSDVHSGTPIKESLKRRLKEEGSAFAINTMQRGRGGISSKEKTNICSPQTKEKIFTSARYF